MDFDPSKITYSQLLGIFWKAHDPATASWSHQYRAVIFTMNSDQKRLALESKAALEKAGVTVATEIEPLVEFTWAEDYHQKYSLRANRGITNELKRYYPNERDFENSTAAARLNAYLAGDGNAKQLESEIGQLGISEAAQKMVRQRVGTGGGSCGSGGDEEPNVTR